MISTRLTSRAFSSEVETGSREENASNQESRALVLGEQRSNRETKKPKKDKIKVIAAAPSQKAGGWQPTVGSGKKK